MSFIIMYNYATVIDILQPGSNPGGNYAYSLLI